MEVFIYYLMLFYTNKKVELLAWVLPFTFLLCNGSYKCKYQNIEPVCGITEIMQFMFCGLTLEGATKLVRRKEHKPESGKLGGGRKAFPRHGMDSKDLGEIAG